MKLDNYPEGLGKLMIINAPYIFSKSCRIQKRLS